MRVISLSKDKRKLVVGGADLLDGTPILDVKPYTPAFESIPDATVPDWVGVEKGEVFTVEWSDAAKRDVRGLIQGKHTQFYGKNEVCGCIFVDIMCCDL